MQSAVELATSAGLVNVLILPFHTICAQKGLDRLNLHWFFSSDYSSASAMLNAVPSIPCQTSKRVSLIKVAYY